MNTELIKSYNEIQEEYRLQSSLARKVEFISTSETLTKYISKDSRILDIGCGAGLYSIYFSRICKETVALDIVPKHIKLLKADIESKGLNISAFVGDARNLKGIDSKHFDVVLCLGPLYHLTNSNDREKCIEECIRVTKHGGFIAVAYISPLSVFPCVIRGDINRISDSLYTKILDNKFIDSNDDECFWTDNNYYTPDEIETFLKNEGLEIVDHLATDGQSIGFQSMINTMNEEQFDIWLNYHRKICRNRSILGISNHGLIIAKRL